MSDSMSNESCSSKAKCRICGMIFAVAHIAILTCLSMAAWKIAWAVEALNA